MISCYTLLFLTSIICSVNSSKLRSNSQSVKNKYLELMKQVLHEDEHFIFRNLRASIYSAKPTKSPTKVKQSPAPTATITIISPTESPIRMPEPVTTATITINSPTESPIRMPEPITTPPVRFPDLAVDLIPARTDPPTLIVVPPVVYEVSGAKAKSVADYSCDDPESRKEGILNALSGITADMARLSDTSTPQGKASQWIIENDNMSLCPDSANLLQRYILSLLYFSTNGETWTRCFENDTSCLVPYNWTPYLSDEPECKWVGTFCNADGEVTGIIFKENGLSGIVPSEITNLSFLEALVLEGGVIQGAIPQQIGDLQKLKFLDLSNNNFVGDIPMSLYDINTLVQLDLSHNQLAGPLSSQIGSMESLEFLQLEGNQFSGDVPAELADLTSLQEVTLMDNQFSGNMPTSICQNRDDVGGSITVLTSDCSTEQISCDCCTTC